MGKAKRILKKAKPDEFELQLGHEPVKLILKKRLGRKSVLDKVRDA